MEDEDDNGVIRYRRRVDRTPEKEFGKLPETEKKLLSTMRGALENCVKKVDRLKYDITERDKMIDIERNRRKEAEDRLRSYLVDPYPTPEVNSELRRRLPRANKSDPLLDKEEDASTDDAKETDNTFVEKSSPKTSVSPGRASSKKNKKKVRRTLNFQPQAGLKPAGNTQDHADGDVDDDDLSSGDELPPPKHHSRRDRGRMHHPQHTLPQYPPPPNAYYPGMGYRYPVDLYSPHYGRPLPLTPWSSASSINFLPASPSPGEPLRSMQVPRIPQSASLPSLNSFNGDVYSGIRDRIQSSSLTALSSPRVDTDANAKPAETESVTGNAGNDNAGADNTATDPPPPFSAASQPSAPSDPKIHSASSSSSHFGLPPFITDQRFSLPPVSSYLFPAQGLGGGLPAHQVTMLHEEIGRLKEANKQLSDRLLLSSQEMEALKLQIASELPSDATFDGQAAKKLADFMEQVKKAEEKREKAFEARMQQADEDRDEALRSLSQHQLQSSASEVEKGTEAVNANRREARTEPPYRRAQVYHRKPLDVSDSSSESDDSEDEDILFRKKSRQQGPALKKYGTQESSSDADRRQGKLVEEVERRHQREREMFREELQVTIEQRDQAVEQLRREREKQRMQQIRMPGQREQMLMAKITTLQQERNKAFEMVRQLQEEQYDNSLMSSLHKALFPDSAMNDVSATYAQKGKLDPHDAEQEAEEEAEEEEMQKANFKENNQLLDQLRQAGQQNAVLQQRCQELEAACSHEKGEKSKLERLNGVLRKKLIATSTGSAQVEEE